MTGTPRMGRLPGVEPRIERLNSPDLHRPPGYHHVTVVDAGPTAYLAGQCPIDVHGDLVGAAHRRAATVVQRA